MLRRLEIEAFKAYDDEALALEPFTVLVGRNGSGKTSVLQSIEFLHGLVIGSLADHLASRGWDYKDLPRLRSERFEFGFRGLFEIGEELLVWELRLGKRLRPGIARERVTRLESEPASDCKLGDAKGQVVLDREGRSMSRLDEAIDEWEEVTQTLTSSWLSLVDLVEDIDRFPALVALARWARSVQPYLVLDPNRLREPSRLTNAGIGAAGADLAGFLRYLRNRRPAAFERVQARVTKAYPRLQEVELVSAGAGQYALAVREDWIQGGPNPRLNARQASDGLLRLFALAAMPELDDPPTLLMIDELENGIHPQLLGSVVDLLVDLGYEDGIQVVSTSHSPIVLSYAEPEAVLLTRRDDEGRAETVPLVETPGYANLNGALSAGEMWLSLGEDGLVRGRAVSRA